MRADEVSVRFQTDFMVDIPTLGVSKRPVHFPKHVLHPPYKKASDVDVSPQRSIYSLLLTQTVSIANQCTRCEPQNATHCRWRTKWVLHDPPDWCHGLTREGGCKVKGACWRCKSRQMVPQRRGQYCISFLLSS